MVQQQTGSDCLWRWVRYLCRCLCHPLFFIVFHSVGVNNLIVLLTGRCLAIPFTVYWPGANSKGQYEYNATTATTAIHAHFSNPFLVLLFLLLLLLLFTWHTCKYVFFCQLLLIYIRWQLSVWVEWQCGWRLWSPCYWFHLLHLLRA